MHRQTLAFSLGCLIVVLIAAVALGQRLVGDDAPGWLGKLGPGSEPRTVLVIVVQDRRAVWTVLAAVEGDRVVAASPEAFALRDRRIVSASFEAVGPLLSLAGWRDEGAGRPEGQGRCKCHQVRSNQG